MTIWKERSDEIGQKKGVDNRGKNRKGKRERMGINDREMMEQVRKDSSNGR